MSIKYWWSENFQWFCVRTDDGVNQTTVSLSREEAGDLSMEADPIFADLLQEGQKRALKLLDAARSVLSREFYRPMDKRCPQYLQGRREAIKWAITWLHARAETMNDPHAKAILNVAGTDMGFDTRDGSFPKVKRKHVDRTGHLAVREPPQC